MISFSKLGSSSQLCPLVTLAFNSHNIVLGCGSSHAMHPKGLTLEKRGIKNNGEVLPFVLLLIELKISIVNWMPVL